MASGTIARLVRDRGFGFIQPSEGGNDVFFHSSAVQSPTFDELNEGEQVEFDVEADPRQPNRSRATNVRRAG